MNGIRRMVEVSTPLSSREAQETRKILAETSDVQLCSTPGVRRAADIAAAAVFCTIPRDWTEKCKQQQATCVPS